MKSGCRGEGFQGGCPPSSASDASLAAGSLRKPGGRGLEGETGCGVC